MVKKKKRGKKKKNQTAYNHTGYKSFWTGLYDAPATSLPPFNLCTLEGLTASGAGNIFSDLTGVLTLVRKFPKTQEDGFYKARG